LPFICYEKYYTPFCEERFSLFNPEQRVKKDENPLLDQGFEIQ
jgi:hypothetical protein